MTTKEAGWGRAGLRWRTWLCGFALLGAGAACAPSARTVANVTTGITGCPSEALVVFDYVKATRTWSASCADTMYVCSDGRGDARCAVQQPGTINPERQIRAKALLQLPPERRASFVDRDITSEDWPGFAQRVAIIKAMTDQQLKDVNPQQVFAGGSADLEPALRSCQHGGYTTLAVDDHGELAPPVNIMVQYVPPPACATAVKARAELAPLRKHPGQQFVILPGVFDIKPIERPTLVAATPASADEPAAAPAATNHVATAPATAELDAAVRQWLDQHGADIATCTGKDRSAVLVKISAEGKAEVSLRGMPAGGPEEGCVRSALSTPPSLPSGPGQILHVVKSGS